jgi:hypothetical protein
MGVLAYLFYGDKPEYQWELLFSLFSALRQMRADGDREVKISVMSDRPHLNLPVDHLPISPAEFTTWTTSPHGVYNHRRKIHALIKALDHYQCPVALIDTDTYFTQHPAQLFDRISPQQTVMHQLEYAHIVNHPLWSPLVAQMADGLEISGVKISPKSGMFNSGVIGVEPSHRELLARSLNVVDELYGRSPLFNVEQFAVGVTLNQFTQLSTSADLIEHYYGHSRGFIHLQIARAFQSFNIAALERRLNNPEPLEVGYPAKAVPDQIIARLLGTLKRWNNNYRFAYLAYRSAFFYATRDADYANIWATTALQTLQFNPDTFSLDSAQQDFQRFKSGKIEALAWLEPKLKQKWLQFWGQ